MTNKNEKGLSRADLNKIRQNPNSPEVDRFVNKQIDELLVAGKIHRFTIEHRCRVCQDSSVRQTVNKLLARGLSYTEVLEALSGVNAARPSNRQISKDSIRTHHKNHFPIDEPAAALYRKIMQEEAERENKDWIDGIGGMLNVFTYLRTMESKGYEALVSDSTTVTPVEGMNASIKRHELMKEDTAAAQIADAYHKMDIVIKVVKENVPAEYWPAIIAGIDAYENGVIEAEVDDDEPEDEEPDSLEMSPEERARFDNLDIMGGSDDEF